MIRISRFPASLTLAWLVALVAASAAQDDKGDADPIARDLKLLQGQWELFHGNEGKGAPTIRSVKEVVGNKETLRRYDIATGKKVHEHSVDFTLTASGSVHVFTFYAVGGDPKQGASFVYRIDANDFYDIPGLLRGDEFRNYQQGPTIWHWTRVKEEKEVNKDSIEEKLKKKVSVDFRRVPLQDPLAFIGQECGIKIEIDGEALKAGGYTKNIPQTFSSDEITAIAAIHKIASQYQNPQKPNRDMVIVVDEPNKKIMFTTREACEQQKLTPFPFPNQNSQ